MIRTIAAVVAILGVTLIPAGCRHTATVCHFDGGGTISVGQSAETTEHTVWVCTEDGTLKQLRSSK